MSAYISSIEIETITKRPAQVIKLGKIIMTTTNMETLTKGEISEKEGLGYVETTTGTNGYPENIKGAIIGFETFEQAQDVADKYGLSIELFKKKSGWSLWSRTGNRMYKEMEISEEDYGDNYSSFFKMDEEEFYEMEVEYRLDEFDNLKDLKDFLKQKEEIWEEIEDMEDDEIVITNYGEYYDTVKGKTMHHSHDTWTHAIGLI